MSQPIYNPHQHNNICENMSFSTVINSSDCLVLLNFFLETSGSLILTFENINNENMTISFIVQQIKVESQSEFDCHADV